MLYLLLLVVSAPLAPAAELVIGRSSGDPGSSVTIPVALKTAGSPITSLQLEIEYDDDALTLEVRRGVQAEGASKQVKAANSAKNRSRILVYGVNHNNIEDGVLLQLAVRIKASTAAGEYRLVGKSAVATNASGAAMAVTVNSGALTVRAAP